MATSRNRSWRAGVATVVAAAIVSLWFTLPGGTRVVNAQGIEQVAVLIAFRSAPGPAEEAIVRGAGGTVKYRYTLVNAIAARLPEAALTGLQRNPNVVSVERDVEIVALDGELDNTWGVKRIGGGFSVAGGAGVEVAVLDSGVDCGHAELSGHCGGGWDYVNNDNDAADDNGHGTHVSGTIAATKNGAGVVGVAPAVSVRPYKVLGATGSGSFSDVIKALQDIVNEGTIKITSNSYGSSSDPGTVVRAAFDNAAAYGVLHIAAAGNSGNCAGKNNSVGYPARYDSVVAVAATGSDASNTRACFSSTGPAVEIAAPGVGILSTVPGGGYEAWNGTSMATPHVSGVAALVKAANPSLSAAEIRAILAGTAADLGAGGRDAWYGFGLVNAVAAITAAGSGGTGGGGGEGEAGILSVASLSYQKSGPKFKISVTVVDGNAVPFTGATVSIDLLLDGALFGSASGTTGSEGQVTFTVNGNVPSGSYTTTITSVAAPSFTWDGVQPSDPGYTK